MNAKMERNWYYDENGKDTDNGSSYVYSIIIYFEDEKVRIAGAMNTKPMFDGMQIYVGMEYISGLFEWNDDEVDVYVDDVKCTTMMWDDIRVIILPFDRRNHTIEVYRSPLMKEEISFSYTQCEKITNEAYGIWFDYQYSGVSGQGSLETKAFETTHLESDLYYFVPESFIILVDGKPMIYKEWLEMELE